MSWLKSINRENGEIKIPPALIGATIRAEWVDGQFKVTLPKVVTHNRARKQLLEMWQSANNPLKEFSLQNVSAHFGESGECSVSIPDNSPLAAEYARQMNLFQLRLGKPKKLIHETPPPVKNSDIATGLKH